MGVNEIVCGVCGSHNFKTVDGKHVCQGCGYVLTEEDTNNVLEFAYHEVKKRCNDLIYTIEYEHVKDELVVDEKTKWNFNRVKDTANHYRLELSDDDFLRFFKLQLADKDISWLMNQMSTYKLSLVDALISYQTY